MKSGVICASISGLILLVYGLYLMIFKDTITNRDIMIYLFVGFAYVGYRFSMLEGR